MSGPGPIVPPFNGTYAILSSVTGPTCQPVGVTSSSEPNPTAVCLNQPVRVWSITPQNGGYQFCVRGYLFTGVDQGTDGNDTNTVIATNDSTKDVTWYITLSESQNAYVITQGPVTSNSPVGWTVPYNSDEPPIVIRPIVNLAESDASARYLSSQLFMINPL